MPDPPYSSFSREQLILRDHLAADRTILANERTFLAYLRTALAFGAAGAALLKLVPNDSGIRLFGWLLIPLGIAVFAVGVLRFLKFHRSLRVLREDKSLED